VDNVICLFEDVDDYANDGDRLSVFDVAADNVSIDAGLGASS
jgi:hypothetical protein